MKHVICGSDGVLEGLRPGGIVVDMTTSSPLLAKYISQSALDKGIYAIDAPVSGGDVGAKTATLSIMLGGEKKVCDSIDPLLRLMGHNIRYMGTAGCGQHTKMVNQILIASNMIGVVEGLVYGYKAGLDLNEVITAVSAGAAGSWSITNLGPRIVDRNFEPGFFVDHFIKDMGIALDESKRMGLSLQGLSLAHQLYISVQSKGYGLKGTQVLALALEEMCGIKRD